MYGNTVMKYLPVVHDIHTKVAFFHQTEQLVQRFGRTILLQYIECVLIADKLTVN